MKKFLGESQKRILELLKLYGCLREDQLEMMIDGEFEQQNFEESLKRLFYYGLIKRENGLVLLSERRYNGQELLLIKAVDVMLSFDFKEIEMHKPGEEPFALTFFKPKDGNLRRYDVCHCPIGREQLLSAQLEAMNGKCRTVIIVVDELSQQKGILVECDCCFAITTDAGYRFYAPKILNMN